MRTYTRYLLNSLLTHFAAVIVIFMMVIGGNLIAQLLDKIAEGRYPLDVFLPFLLFTILKSLVFIIPFATTLAIILAFSRKYREGEIYVAFSLGIDYWQLIYTVARLLIPLLILSSVLSLYIIPASKSHYAYLKEAAKKGNDINIVTPGKFISLGEHTVLFVEAYDRDEGRLDNLFIAHRTADEFIMETAARGKQGTEDGEKRLYLYDGKRYQGIPGETYFQVSQFSEHWIVLPPVVPSSNFDRPDMLAFKHLLSSGFPEHQAEIQIRLAMPIATALLALFALLISQIPPRRDRHIRITVAILVCLAYLNANALVGELIASGDLPVFPGIWGVHGMMLLLIAAFLWRRGFFSTAIASKAAS